MHMGSAWVEFRPGHQLSWPISSQSFPGPSIQMPGLGHSRFLPDPFHFINPVIRCHEHWTSDNKYWVNTRSSYGESPAFESRLGDMLDSSVTRFWKLKRDSHYYTELGGRTF
jgi:hypothetical protein